MAGCERSGSGWCARGKRGSPTPSSRPSGRAPSPGGTAPRAHRRGAARGPCAASAARASLVESDDHPLVGLRQHEGASTRSPSISTTQARQLPSARMPFAGSRGAGCGCRGAARPGGSSRRGGPRSRRRRGVNSARRRCPLPWPSLRRRARRRSVIPFAAQSRDHGLHLRIRFGLQLVGEVLHDAAHGVRRRLAEPADRRVGHGRPSSSSSVGVPALGRHQLDRLRRADAARRALAARLVREEAHEVERRIARAVLVGEDDDGGGADEAAVFGAGCRSRGARRPGAPAGSRPRRRPGGSA